jgi:hypothetical protein
VRRVPVLYRTGGWTGRQIVLVGVLPAGSLPPVVRTTPPARESDFEEENQHDWRYVKEKQKYLRKAHKRKNDWRNLPGFIKGWITQEKKRRSRIRNRQPSAGFTVSGQSTTQDKLARMRAIANNPAASDSARSWAAEQIKRLQRGGVRLQRLQTGKRIRTPRLRVPPGFNVSHPVPHQKGVHDWKKFRLDTAIGNQSRPWIARKTLEPRIGQRWKDYAESDFFLED